MPSYQRFVGVGHLVAKPELRYTGSGTSVCSFAFGINRQYRKGDETKREVCFFDVVAFGKMGEFAAQVLDKGDPVLVEGHFRQETWEQHGQSRTKLTLIAEEIRYLKERAGEAGDDGPHEFQDRYAHRRV